MKIIRSIREMREYSPDGTIGFVPTMGALHEGHLSLIRMAQKENQNVVVSIFVNPTQFTPGEDFTEYPRDEALDTELLLKEGVDFLFIPSIAEMYPEDLATRVSLPSLSSKLCGLARPSHFDGVALVLLKLFNIVMPDMTYFGQKDYQQATIVRQLINDLNFPIKFRMLSTVREESGLAMSSRNAYLNEAQKEQAESIYKMLRYTESLIKDGERDVAILKQDMETFFDDYKEIKVDYVDILKDDLTEVELLLKGRYVLAVSVYLGETRLIDNILVDV